jgi:hypothetical protein
MFSIKIQHPINIYIIYTSLFALTIKRSSVDGGYSNFSIFYALDAKLKSSPLTFFINNINVSNIKKCFTFLE